MRVFWAVLLMWVASPALAATRYVATTGSDSNSCAASTSSSTPKRNLKGASGAIACMASGDTLIIKGGTYTENNIGAFADFQIPSGTNDSTRTTVRAETGETVILKPTSGAETCMYVLSKQFITLQDIIFDGANISGYPLYVGRNATTDTPASDVTINGCTFRNGPLSGFNVGWRQDTVTTNCGMRIIDTISHDNARSGAGHGIYLQCRGALIDGGEYYNHNGNASLGISVYSHGSEVGGNAWTGTSGTIVRNVVAHNNSIGILISNGVGDSVYNNVAYDNGTGIALRYGCNTCSAYNNTIYSNDGTGLLVDGLSGNNASPNALIRNNISFLNGGANFLVNANGAVFSNNLCSSSSSYCLGVGTNPATVFTNAPAFDFTLVPNSPAIGAAVTISTFSTDFAGNTRTVPWDSGAYEFVSVTNSISLSVPNGGEQWVKTVEQEIVWASANVTNVRIRADRGNDGTFEETVSASTPSDGSFLWTPGGTANASVKLEICDAADFSPCVTSSAVFAITDAAGGSLTKIISNNTTGSFVGDISGVDDVRMGSSSGTTNLDGDLIRIQRNDAGSSTNGLIRFTGLSQIPDDATITSVTLGLFLESSSVAGSMTVNFHQALRAWTESGATWNLWSTGNSWTTPGALGAGTDRASTSTGSMSVSQTSQFYTITNSGSGGLKDLVQDWVDGSTVNNGLQIQRSTSSSDGMLRRFTDSEGTNGNRPYLSVTYITSTATITVTEPGQSLDHVFPGQVVPVRWQSQNVSGDVKAEISLNGGASYQPVPIIESYPFNGSDATWTVDLSTTPPCQQCKIKVTSLTDTNVFGESSEFKIAGSLLEIK